MKIRNAILWSSLLFTGSQIVSAVVLFEGKRGAKNARHGDTSFFEKNISEIDVNNKWYGETYLMLACKGIEQKVNGKTKDEYGAEVDQTKSSWIVTVGHLEIVQKLIRTGSVNLNVQSSAEATKGQTAIHYASFSGSPHILAEILSIATQEQVNMPDALGQTALHIAAYHKKEAAVKMLLEAGANPNAVNLYHRTALEYAIHSNSPGIVKLMLDNAYDVNYTPPAEYKSIVDGFRQNFTSTSSTALMLASNTECDDVIVEELIKHDANLDLQNKNGMTALMLAASKKTSINKVRILKDAGANLNVTNTLKETAQIIAAKSGNYKAQELLQQKDFGISGAVVVSSRLTDFDKTAPEPVKEPESFKDPEDLNLEDLWK